MSESFLGEFIAGKRDSFVIGTKFTDAFPGKDGNRAGNGRKSMIQSIERSLQRLESDYVTPAFAGAVAIALAFLVLGFSSK